LQGHGEEEEEEEEEHLVSIVKTATRQRTASMVVVDVFIT